MLASAVNSAFLLPPSAHLLFRLAPTPSCSPPERGASGLKVCKASKECASDDLFPPEAASSA